MEITIITVSVNQQSVDTLITTCVKQFYLNENVYWLQPVKYGLWQYFQQRESNHFGY